ncbi:hypothetical protein ACWCPQ_11510 [Nocardia sp. NPDC001965]
MTALAEESDERAAVAASARTSRWPGSFAELAQLGATGYRPLRVRDTLF